MTTDASPADAGPAEPGPRASAGGVQSVQRAFEILELLAANGGKASLTALASMTTLPQPTIHRLLGTLVSLGYVSRGATRDYYLAPRLIRLGDTAQKQLATTALPTLAELVDQLGESVNLAVLDQDMVAYIGQAPSRHSVRMFTEVGRRVHAHNSGVGKAILAQLPVKTVRAIIERQGLPVATNRTISTLDALERELDWIREHGYAVDNGEQEVGVRCYAVAVPGVAIPTAISASGPDSRVTDEFGARAVPLLQEAAARLSAVIQH